MKTEIAKIELGLSAFENKKSEIIDLANGAKIYSEISDKAGYKIVSTYRKKLKQTRVEISKEGKAIRDTINPIINIILEKEKELIAIITPEEERLLALEKAFEKKLEEEKAKKEREENEKAQKRVDKLATYDYHITLAEAKALSEDEYEDLLVDAHFQFQTKPKGNLITVMELPDDPQGEIEIKLPEIKKEEAEEILEVFQGVKIQNPIEEIANAAVKQEILSEEETEEIPELQPGKFANVHPIKNQDYVNGFNAMRNYILKKIEEDIDITIPKIVALIKNTRP